MRKYKEYAIYKGDEFLYMGTVIKIDTERDEEGNYDFKITIDEGDYKIYKDT